ncbi:MAG TPA: GntR family transcriptional regulator [Longimicrobiaceae bacterium]
MKAEQLTFRRSRTSTVVEQIWSELRRMILQGTLTPGTRLVELDIAAQSSASQASVREALHRLERDGLVIRRGRRGTFVTEVEPDKMLEVFHVRAAVESVAIRRAVERMTPERLAELERLVDRMRMEGLRGDATAVVEADMAFHGRLCAWADHPTLLRVWELLYTQMERFLVLYDVEHFADLTQVAANHEPVLEAIRSGDADEAASAIHEHVLIGAPPMLVAADNHFFSDLRRRAAVH